MKVRYMKIVRDLTADYAKNLMLVLAIAIGVFGIGAVLGAYSVLDREMAVNYQGTNPASATIEIEQGISETLLDSVRNFPGIAVAERHATLTARMKVEDRWYPILLFIIDDFKNKKTNRVYYQSGSTSPAIGEMLVERTAFSVMRSAEGGELLLKTPRGESRLVKLSGTVHDPGLAPAWQEEAGYGYISLATLHWLGESQGFDQLRIHVREHSNSSDHIRKKAEELSSWLELKGYHVREIQVPPPGKHPHQGQMNAVLSIFTSFSFLILVLGSILVATALSNLMVKQVRQIGVIKTIGANARQVAVMYIFMILSLCVVALLVAIPLSYVTASVFYNQIAGLLNLEITNTTIPLWVPGLQVTAGILIPLIAASFPVIRGSLVPVRKALDNFGVMQQRNERSIIVRLSRSSFLNDTFRLALRNVFRQKSRLVMTLGLLAAGGAMFTTALNISEAWEKNLNEIYIQRLYDFEVKFEEAIIPGLLLEKIKAIKGVHAAEAWTYASTSHYEGSAHSITQTYPDKGHGSFTILGLPVPTKLLNLEITEGRWLYSSGARHVVLNQRARRSDVKIGDMVSLIVHEKVYQFEVIGFSRDVGSAAAAYISIDVFPMLEDEARKSNMFRIAYEDRSRESAFRLNREIESFLSRENISVTNATPVWVLRNAVAAHMRVLVNSLIAMAILMVVVGTLALASTMSINVMERTREIGVMRAIGATPAKIRILVVWEGLMIGAISFLLTILLSLVLSYYFGRFIGHISFGIPLSLTVCMLGFIAWAVILATGAFIATLLPAKRAGNMSAREALAYE